MSNATLKPSLLKYVERNSNLYGIEWDPNISEQLPFDPFDTSDQSRKITAHFFLLIASINETELIGRAENSRALMTYFYKIFHPDLFHIISEDQFSQYLSHIPCYHELGLQRNTIPYILASANRFIQQNAQGNLIDYATRFSKPKDFVEVLTGHIDRMSVEKAWMYLRWMTRPHPDLGVFDNFSPAELQIPLTSYIRDVGYCLGVCPNPVTDWWLNDDELLRVREKITEFAQTLYPDDPCKVDYPFYLLGRWIRGKRLNRKLIIDYLDFFEDIYRKTGTVPVTYDIVSRDMSSFESQLDTELRKMEILFSYESHKFTLRKRITYRPDFVLPTCKVKGKTVLLEPHGIWTQKTRRRVNLGRKSFTIYALPPKLDRFEIQFTEKLRMFREMYGKDYYVILLVPNQVLDRVQKNYHHSYDAVYMSADIPDVLYQLKKL